MFLLLMVTHALSCFFMTGLIWLIQLVHYPSFQYVNPLQFIEFNHFHQKSISFIVTPIMFIELLTGLSLLFLFPQTSIFLMLFCLLVPIWIFTLFLSVPLHRTLLKGYNSNAIRQLVLTNWLRTSLWSFRSLLIFGILTNEELLKAL